MSKFRHLLRLVLVACGQMICDVWAGAAPLLSGGFCWRWAIIFTFFGWVAMACVGHVVPCGDWILFAYAGITVTLALWLVWRICVPEEGTGVESTCKSVRCEVSRYADLPIDDSDHGTVEEFMELVCDIDEGGMGLTSWEVNFIAGFIDNPPHTVSEKQWETLLRIQEDRM